MRRTLIPILLSLAALALSACQSTQPMVARAMVRHWSMLDLSGLGPLLPVDAVKVSLAVPTSWSSSNTLNGLFYSHRQWRSPSHATAFGVAYLHLPIPLSGKTLLRLAEEQYAKKGKSGKILAEWTDQFGRLWFIGENEKYHGRGYILVDGLKAWFVYVGFERDLPASPMELALGQRAFESVLPRGVALAASRAD